MPECDTHKLLEAVDATLDPTILDLDTPKIRAAKNDVLQRLRLPRAQLIKYNQSLKGYRHIDNLDQLQEGAYVRWITLRDDMDFTLTQGGHVCRVDIADKVRILCRNKVNRMFSFDFNAALVFVKLTPQELLLISALDHLAK